GGATRADRYRQIIVRVQLTLGRGADAVPLDNHGILVFRSNGTLADYHAPIPPDAASQTAALALLSEGRRRGLDAHGAPLSIVRRPDGELAVEARRLGADGPTVWVDAFTLGAPGGERREIVSRSSRGGGGARRGGGLRRAGTALPADDRGR